MSNNVILPAYTNLILQLMMFPTPFKLLRLTQLLIMDQGFTNLKQQLDLIKFQYMKAL